MSYLPLIDLKNGFWPVVHLLYGISEWNFTDMLNIKGYIFLVRTVTLTFPVHELSTLDWSEKWFLTCTSFTIWSIWMKLHRYVDHQRLHIVTKDVISLSISVLLLFRHYISHKITFGAPSSGGVLRSACGAFIDSRFIVVPIICGRRDLFSPCFVIQYLVFSSFVIIWLRMRASCFTLWFCCLVAVSVLCLFLAMLWVGLKTVIVAFPGHTCFLNLKIFSYGIFSAKKFLTFPGQMLTTWLSILSNFLHFISIHLPRKIFVKRQNYPFMYWWIFPLV